MCTENCVYFRRMQPPIGTANGHFYYNYFGAFLHDIGSINEQCMWNMRKVTVVVPVFDEINGIKELLCAKFTSLSFRLSCFTQSYEGDAD